MTDSIFEAMKIMKIYNKDTGTILNELPLANAG